MFFRLLNLKMSTNLTLRSILDANKLTGHNYSDWLRNLRIVLRQEKKLYVLDTPAPSEPCSDATDEEWEKYQRYIDDNEQATCVMLACMSPELQRQHENMDAPTMILHLKELFGFVMDHELSIDLVLQSLSSSFSQLVMNFNMNQKDMTLPELLNMFKTAEGCLKKEPSSVLVVSSSKSKKKSFKKNKNKKQKASTNVVKAKGGVKKKSNDKGTCFNCRIDEH
ncbi:hypothetical protein K2173_023912 [Erythroxylum novogranatense]|uniref:Retrotransposon Copia-like N-terminal domain-containing protein n=1 Tax=Erythroxylum novogranatense TaxID=1862640 RepID=A0AAV8TPW5_9ROSI|nr:hypothetical protein K2173_023912 [Erythroxylum novogranatense]